MTLHVMTCQNISEAPSICCEMRSAFKSRPSSVIEGHLIQQGIDDLYSHLKML